MNGNDTICALATAPGGALGIIRVSGPDALPIVSSLCSVSCATCAANTVHYTRLLAPSIQYVAMPSQQEILDDVILTIFHAPHSYTGEDTVEISCHGSRYIIQRILDVLVEQGCRMAQPGEFTMRAYFNGKMDLSQAEAVADLITSTNKATHDIALSQLRGHFSSELKTLREKLLKLTSLLELELDFSDHEDLEFADRTELLTLARSIDTHITRLAHTFETGQALKQGIPVAIIGKTNVGKSTLLNALLKDDRAIVSDIHGTTRDTIEDTIDIRGVTFRFIDTAGIRQTTDAIERIGIDRTYAAIDKARIVLWLIDTPPAEAEITDITSRMAGNENVPARTLIPVWNKADIIPPCPVCCDSIVAPVPISAKTGQGLPVLEQAIYAAANIPALTDTDVIITSARHYEALTRAHGHLLRVLDGLGAANSQLSIFNSQLPTDLVAEDLRLTLDTLAEITGGLITPQETLNNIFSHFCVGK